MQVLLWVVVLSLLFAAAALGVIAWRTARSARDRESARVELLRALAFPDASIPQWTAEFLPEPSATPAEDAYEPTAPIFAERAEPVAALPRWISLSGVGVAMALGVTLYAALAGGPEAASAITPAARVTAAPGAPATANARTPVPDRRIELIALRHQFGPATAFDVRGLVRNPADGRALTQLVAVVSLFDAGDRILASQMTPVERPVLEAGQTSAFSLVFPRVTGTVARYQVEFRLNGRDTIPHVDRRAAEAVSDGPSS